MNRGAGSRTPRWVVVVGALLTLISMGYAWRARGATPGVGPASSGDGVFSTEGAASARATAARLAHGLMACQDEDGSFRTQPARDGTGYNDAGERMVASGLATAALLTARAHGALDEAEAARLDAAVARAMAYLRGAQLPDGTFARTDARDPWAAVQATAAAVLAMVLLDDPQDAPLRQRAAQALQRLAAGRLAAGWGRSLVAIVADRLRAAGLDADLEGGSAVLVDVRISDVAPSSDAWLSWDTTLSEVLARVVKSTRTGAFDPLPAQALETALTSVPTWRGEATAPRSWWAQGWLVARSGDFRSRAWFDGLCQTVAGWQDETTGLLPSGFYGTPLDLSAVALLALDEGLRGLPPAPA